MRAACKWQYCLSVNTFSLSVPAIIIRRSYFKNIQRLGLTPTGRRVCLPGHYFLFLYVNNFTFKNTGRHRLADLPDKNL